MAFGHAPLPADPESFRRLSHAPQTQQPAGFVSNQDLINATEELDEAGMYAFRLPDGRLLPGSPSTRQRRRVLIEQARVTPERDYAAEVQDRHQRRTSKIILLEIKDQHRQAEDMLRQIAALQRMVAAKEKTIIDLHERQAEAHQCEDIVERAGLGMQLAAAGRIAESEAEDAKAALVKAKAQLKAQGDFLRDLALELVQKARWDYQDRVIAAAQTAIKQACGSIAEPADMAHIISRIETVKRFGTDVRLFPEYEPQSWGSTLEELEKLVTATPSETPR